MYQQGDILLFITNLNIHNCLWISIIRNSDIHNSNDAIVESQTSQM